VRSSTSARSSFRAKPSHQPRARLLSLKPLPGILVAGLAVAALASLANPEAADARTCKGVSIVHDQAAFYEIVARRVGCRRARRIVKRFAIHCRPVAGFRVARRAHSYPNLELVNGRGKRIRAYAAGGGFPCEW
jgi:hypothetical protein